MIDSQQQDLRTMPHLHDRMVALIVATALGISATLTPQAEAGGISLGSAANYGILVEPGVHNFQLDNSTITGNVGIGAGLSGPSNVQIAGNGFIIEAVAGQPNTGQLRLVD